MTLQESTQKLREAESLVAQLTGELRVLESQEQSYTTKLAELGLTADQVPAALAQLEVEEKRLEDEIENLSAQLKATLP